MRILITGSSGMLGRALCQELGNKYEVLGLDVVRTQKPEQRNQQFIECDITDQERTISEISAVKPDIVIHTAAYTDVDGCELNPEQAYKVNAQGTETVAKATQQCAAFICYISTDFVFDGDKKTAYTEKDQPNPINIYGKSKLAGERYAQAILKRFIIIRTSWLFGQGGKNFVDTLLKKMQNGEEIKVVNDQFGSPSYAKDLARAIDRLLGLGEYTSNIYHITNSGSCSWYEFAQAIKETAKLDAEVVPTSSEQYRKPARRPKMSILENRYYQEATGEKLPYWQDALKEYLG